MTIATRVATLAALLALVTCSSSTPAGPSPCAPFTATGGSIVGEWTFVGACAIGPGDVACSTAKATTTGTASGTLTFGTDGTYSQALNYGYQETLVLPAACLSNASSCSIPNAVIGLGVGCTGNPATSCTCPVTYTAPTLSVTGTFNTVNGNLNLTPNGAEPYQITYSVQGNAVWLRSSPSAPYGADLTLLATR